MRNNQENLLSEDELTLVLDREVMPMKVRICLKVEKWLDDFRKKLADYLEKSPGLLPKQVGKKPGKISRGENYQMYPYRVLDFPAHFDREDLFTFRTVWLWGHPIGFHLIISGRYKAQFEVQIIARLKQLPPEFVLAAHPKPWIWEAEAEGSMPLGRITQREIERIIAERDFIKISYFIPLADYAHISNSGLSVWKSLETLLHI